MSTEPEIGVKAAFMSGNMAQLTVFLTGLVLAVTSYVILNLLIQQIVEEDARRQVVATQQTAAKSLLGLGDTLFAAATILGNAQGDMEESRALVLRSAPGLGVFDRLIWLKPTEKGDWQAITLQTREPETFSQGSMKSLVHAILAQRAAREDAGMTVLAAPPGTAYWQESADPVVKSRPFVMATAVLQGDVERGLLVGLARASTIFDRSWLEESSSISRFVIRDSVSNEKIFYMSRDPAAAEEDAIIDAESATKIVMGTGPWEIAIVTGSNRQTAILENMPWLMLAFGVILTLLGTLYVRNNQSQSYKLAVMNRQLAQKNYELNSEVAERERLNQFLRKAEREYKAIIDSVSDIIFESTINGELVFLNDAWFRITGFDNEQIIGRSLFELLHPQDQEEQRTGFEQLVKGKRGAYRTFTRIRSADGTFRSVEMAISMLRQDENRNMRVVGTFTDVEERRRAEKALSEAEKKYRTIVENAAGGIYQVTPDGQFLSANPAMARILGYDTADQMLREIRNAHDHLYLSARERAGFIRELETAGFIHNFESEVRTRGRGRIWVNENARVVRDDEGNVLYYEGSMEDITQRRDSEASLRAAKIQSDLANRAKSEFLANMSHELRTPLNAIIGFSEIIRDEVLGRIENRNYWEYARDIHESGHRLLAIINEILDVSRIEAGDRQINEGVVDMNEVVASCIEFMTQKAAQAQLSVRNMTGGAIPEIIGEELAIKQVIINLIGNSIKFTPEGGRITLSHEVEQNGRLRLAVTDTGIGMEESDIEKALSAFGQVETSFNRSASGAGLGLTLAQSLMTLHGGDLEIFSQKGIGTTVTIIFPAKRVLTDSGKADSAGQHGSSGLTNIH